MLKTTDNKEIVINDFKSLLNNPFFKKHLAHKFECDIKETKQGDIVRRIYNGKNIFYQVLEVTGGLLIVKELKPILTIIYNNDGEDYKYYKFLKNEYMENAKAQKAPLNKFKSCYKVDLYIYYLMRDYNIERIYI